ncbi:hypothetical protein [Phenylobacterium sp.]|uniref:hypothetical protein n=1 Tax=Phenylobacterium sp. TaxID=1871053 RepID=UPI00374D757D
MPRVVIIRLLLFAVPFAVWFVWREVARRSGREMGSTPYAWLVTAGALLFGLSLAATVAFHPDNRQKRYVPGEVTADGSVSKGYFETRPSSPAAPAPPR